MSNYLSVFLFVEYTFGDFGLLTNENEGSTTMTLFITLME
jgi:hypothetical protein